MINNHFWYFFFVIVISMATVLGACSSGETPQTNSSGTANSTVQTVSPDSLQSDTSSFVSFSDDAVMGGNVYVPVYSHIYQRSQQKTFNLTATLSIRNTDLQNSMVLKKVYYYDSKGELVHKYLDQPQSISALSSLSFVVDEEDLRGGVGANFLVLWEAKQPVKQPVIEAVMISTSQQQGISFVSEGRVTHSLNRQ